MGRLLFCVAVGWYIFGAAPSANAQYTILYNFGVNGGPKDPRELDASPDGNLFGVDNATNSDGLYEWSTTGFSQLKISYPKGTHRSLVNLLPYNGGLLCTAVADSPSPPAVCYLEAGSPRWTLHVWRGLASAGYLDGPLTIGTDGNIYGTTASGGAHHKGSIYRIDSVTHKLTVLHSFADGQPGGSVIQATDGNFYGVTEPGKTSHATIFRMDPDGTVKTLYTFADSSSGLVPLIQANDGNFYGTTSAGNAAGYGEVFQMLAANHAVTILHTFQKTDGANPAGVIQGPNSNLYGVAGGGKGSQPDGDGVIYELTTDGTFTVLHYFGDGSVPNDGASPWNLVLATDNNLYGSTAAGGQYGHGTLYKISP